MKLLAFLLLLSLAAVCPAGAEWTPAFDVINCAHRANVVLVGTLDSQGNLSKYLPYKSWWKTQKEPDVLSIDLDQAHLDALRAALGNDGPYEVMLFLGIPQTRSGSLPKLWPLISTYPGLVAFSPDGGVYLTPDDTARGLLVRSSDYTRRSFLDALNAPLNFNDKAADIGNGKQREYDAALVIAVQRGDSDVIKALLAAQADVNASGSEQLGMKGGVYLAERDPGRPPVTTAVAKCGYHKAPSAAYDLLRLLLTRGADPNLPDKYGITPLMMADRVNSEEAAALLKKVGARPFDPKDPKTLAALVRIDAQLMNYVMCERDCWLTQDRAPFSFGKLQAEYGPRYKWAQTYKVIASKAVDLLGNPYILYRNSNENDVRINPKTIAALSSAVDADYWDGFVPEPDDRN